MYIKEEYDKIFNDLKSVENSDDNEIQKLINLLINICYVNTQIETANPFTHVQATQGNFDIKTHITTDNIVIVKKYMSVLNIAGQIKARDILFVSGYKGVHLTELIALFELYVDNLCQNINSNDFNSLTWTYEVIPYLKRFQYLTIISRSKQKGNSTCQEVIFDKYYNLLEAFDNVRDKAVMYFIDVLTITTKFALSLEHVGAYDKLKQKINLIINDCHYQVQLDFVDLLKKLDDTIIDKQLKLNYTIKEIEKYKKEYDVENTSDLQNLSYMQGVYQRTIPNIKKYGDKVLLKQYLFEKQMYAPNLLENGFEFEKSLDVTEIGMLFSDIVSNKSTLQALVDLSKVVDLFINETLYNNYITQNQKPIIFDFFNIKSVQVDAYNNNRPINPVNCYHLQLSLYNSFLSGSIKYLRDRDDLSKEILASALISRISYISNTSNISVLTEGLWQGFCGNWVASLHILLPQIETLLRDFKYWSDDLIIKPRINKAEYILLDDLLKDLVLSDKELCFHLQMLLLNSESSNKNQNMPNVNLDWLNIRNEVLHGLASATEYSLAPTIFLMTIRLLIALSYEYNK